MTDALSEAARELQRCNRCGICTTVCPTFQVTGMETHVTRGRVALAQEVLAGRLSPAQTAGSLDSCLLCQACVGVCPPKVDIVKIVSAVRSRKLTEEGMSLVQRVVLRHVLNRPRLLRLAAGTAALADRVGMRTAALRLGLLRGNMARAAEVGPRLALRGARSAIGQLAPLKNPPRARVAYYVGCAKDAVFPQSAKAAVAVLRANDVKVELPRVPCCGLPHRSAGDLDGMKSQARQVLQMLENLAVDAIIVDDSSCSAHLFKLPEIFSGEPEEASARRIAASLRDLPEFLEEIGPAPMGEIRARVTWHVPCSSRHGSPRMGRSGQDPVESAIRLLQRIPGILFVRTTPATACCGGAGSFMVTQPELSDPLMARTWAALQGSNPEYVLISSPSCAMQLQRGAHAEGSEVQVLHVAEFLAMAYEAASAT